MYLRITVPINDYQAANFPGATYVDIRNHAGVVNVYRECHEFAWEPDGEWWVSFDGGDSSIQSPTWEDWGLVASLPE